MINRYKPFQVTKENAPKIFGHQFLYHFGDIFIHFSQKSELVQKGMTFSTAIGKYCKHDNYVVKNAF